VDSRESLQDRKQFAAGFRISHPATAQRSVPQSLALLNGALVGRLCDGAACPAVIAAASSPFFSTRERVESLILATLNRLPTEPELNRFTAYVEKQGQGGRQRTALADVFWVLLNSAEFNTNH
jgi:hypothetical protein